MLTKQHSFPYCFSLGCDYSLNSTACRFFQPSFFSPHPSESCALTPLLKKVNDVLGEVMYLIERLEADRQYAEEALHKEKKRKEFLESQVDGISLWKRQEHSSVVQKGQWHRSWPHS